MENPKQMANRVDEIWKEMDRGKRIGMVGLFLAFLIAVSAYYVFFGRTVYVPVFSGLEMNDSANIVKKLDELKISDYRIADEGATIMVPDGQVDRLRLDLAMDGLLPNSGKGFEIFDDAGFAVTDEDRKIMYQRALEGELARSIMSLEEVEYARVHLALTQESVFTRDAKSGNATVVVKINPLEGLGSQQIKGIIALVSGALRDIPEGNVRVVDTNANLLSAGIFMEESELPATALADRRMSMEDEFEKNIESGLQIMLEQALGVDKVVVKVNADMDFDSEETTVIEYDDEKVIRSQQDHLVRADGSVAEESSSPVDNNLDYTIEDPEYAAEDESISSYETVRNYEIGETRIHRIKAPGEVRRISTSVIYDGALGDAQKLAINNIIMAAVGYDESRGDIISVEGLPFDKTYQDELIVEMQNQEATYLENTQSRQKMMLYGGIAGGFVLLILMVVAIFVARNGRRKASFSERLDMNMEKPLPIEDVLEDATYKFEFMEDPEIEKSVKKYAEEHPEKLAELVKTWILKDEV
ncbi:MAG TPA: flagellar basal-body MS-ring/collar protein FliF [Clostridia bacterium]|nr:flagellar basal-body MS-ring/collar protein FliF [Clostridia bacterium]